MPAGWGPEGTEAVCMLCGASAAFSDLLVHFYLIHRDRWAGTGVLVRFVLDTGGMPDTRDEVRYPEWTERNAEGELP
jgi:hypothetical protein